MKLNNLSYCTNDSVRCLISPNLNQKPKALENRNRKGIFIRFIS